MVVSKGALSCAISLGCFLVVQSAMAIWWASALTTNVRYMAADIQDLRLVVKEHTDAQNVVTATFLDRGITNAAGISVLKDRCIAFEQRLLECEKRLNAKNGP